MLFRTQAQQLITPRLLNIAGEAVAISALIIMAYFSIWPGLLLLAVGGGLLVGGYILADEKRSARALAKWGQARARMQKLVSR